MDPRNMNELKFRKLLDSLEIVNDPEIDGLALRIRNRASISDNPVPETDTSRRNYPESGSRDQAFESGDLVRGSGGLGPENNRLAPTSDPIPGHDAATLSSEDSALGAELSSQNRENNPTLGGEESSSQDPRLEVSYELVPWPDMNSTHNRSPMQCPVSDDEPTPSSSNQQQTKPSSRNHSPTQQSQQPSTSSAGQRRSSPNSSTDFFSPDAPDEHAGSSLKYMNMLHSRADEREIVRNMRDTFIHYTDLYYEMQTSIINSLLPLVITAERRKRRKNDEHKDRAMKKVEDSQVPECFECSWNYCNTLLITEDFLWAHIDRAHFSTCHWSSCQEELNSEHEFRCHVYTHIVQTCHLCSKIWHNNQVTLQEHYHKVHGVDLAHNLFRPLKYRRRKHGRPLDRCYRCPYCNREYISEIALNLHVEDGECMPMDSGDPCEPPTCYFYNSDGLPKSSVCLWNDCLNYDFANGLWFHMAVQHIEKKACAWKDCLNSFPDKLQLKIHVHRHIHESSLICFICKNEQPSFISYKNHIKTHTVDIKHYRYRRLTKDGSLPLKDEIPFYIYITSPKKGKGNLTKKREASLSTSSLVDFSPGRSVYRSPTKDKFLTLHSTSSKKCLPSDYVPVQIRKKIKISPPSPGGTCLTEPATSAVSDIDTEASDDTGDRVQLKRSSEEASLDSSLPDDRQAVCKRMKFSGESISDGDTNIDCNNDQLGGNVSTRELGSPKKGNTSDEEDELADFSLSSNVLQMSDISGVMEDDRSTESD